ncbi:MAG: hypothetical protein RIC55_15045 [Pirellulaceae bacterium]
MPVTEKADETLLIRQPMRSHRLVVGLYFRSMAALGRGGALRQAALPSEDLVSEGDVSPHVEET